MRNYNFSDIHVGLSEQFEVVVTKEQMSAFLAMTGDVNPLHVDGEYARASGFKEQVVYGMLTASFLSTLVGVYLPGKNALFLGSDTSFAKPVFVNDKLVIKGVVEEVNETFKLIKIKAVIRNQNDEVVLRAKLKVGCRE